MFENAAVAKPTTSTRGRARAAKGVEACMPGFSWRNATKNTFNPSPVDRTRIFKTLDMINRLRKGFLYGQRFASVLFRALKRNRCSKLTAESHVQTACTSYNMARTILMDLSHLNVHTEPTSKCMFIIWSLDFPTGKADTQSWAAHAILLACTVTLLPRNM